MSRRDGHEWERMMGIRTTCEQKDGWCKNEAVWHKILYSCDKSTYDGGFYCQECRDANDDSPYTEPKMPIETIENAALRSVLEACRTIRSAIKNPFMKGSDGGHGYQKGWNEALDEVEASINLAMEIK